MRILLPLALGKTIVTAVLADDQSGRSEADQARQADAQAKNTAQGSSMNK
jgi:hypothetical protein